MTQETRVLFNETCPVCRFEIDAYRRRAVAGSGRSGSERPRPPAYSFRRLDLRPAIRTRDLGRGCRQAVHWKTRLRQRH